MCFCFLFLSTLCQNLARISPDFHHSFALIPNRSTLKQLIICFRQRAKPSAEPPPGARPISTPFCLPGSSDNNNSININTNNTNTQVSFALISRTTPIDSLLPARVLGRARRRVTRRDPYDGHVLNLTGPNFNLRVSNPVPKSNQYTANP